MPGLLLCLWIAAASADPPNLPEPAGADDPMGLAPADLLEVATSAYFAGNVDRALQLIAVIEVRDRSGEPFPVDVYVEALVYKGEILNGQGDPAGAARAFESALERSPDHVLNPYHHPSEVLAVFEEARRNVKERLAQRPPPIAPVIPPAPWYVALPLGIPQFIHDRPIRGAAYAVSQIGFGATAYVTMRRSQAAHGNLFNYEPPETDAEAKSLRELRALNWTSTLAFAGFWTLSYADARTAWRRDHAELSLTVQPLPNGGKLGVVGRF